jgi:DNA repair photolyase
LTALRWSANFPERLRKDATDYQAAGVTEQVMMSFSSDVYHPFDTSLTRTSIKILMEHGMAVCVLSKGGTRALRDLDLFRPTRDAYAATLTTLDPRLSLKFERNAPLPADRITALRAFAEAGIFVWVSLEPILNIKHTLAVIRATHEFVDLYKVGKSNYMGAVTNGPDWRDYTLRAIVALNKYNKPHYVKRDLQPFLPPGYPNPLRRPQHH